MIINRDVKPHETIYYISAILHVILKNNPLNTTDLYKELCMETGNKIDYQIFLFSIDFLFLLNKITINEKGDLKCI